MLQSKNISVFIIAFFLLTTLSGCEAIAGIFKAGIWTGVIVIVVVVALILWLIGRGRK